MAWSIPPSITTGMSSAVTLLLGNDLFVSQGVTLASTQAAAVLVPDGDGTQIVVHGTLVDTDGVDAPTADIGHVAVGAACRTTSLENSAIAAGDAEGRIL